MPPTQVRIEVDPRGLAKLARAAEMRVGMTKIADDAAREITGRLPYQRILGGITVDGRPSTEGADIVVSGSGWHLWEFGTVNHGARPAIRPGAQVALARHGGRFAPVRR